MSKTTNLLIKKDITTNFNIVAVNPDRINSAAVAKVTEHLPALAEKTRMFGSQSSQHSLSLMTLTMMTGHSPYRMMRQVLAEVERRKMALAESQVEHAQLLVDHEELSAKTDPVSQAKFRLKCVSIDHIEEKINGSVVDIAVLIDAYHGIMEKNGITEWDEEDFEFGEKLFHVRRGFDLAYKDVILGGKVSNSTVEYTSQFGVHPQVAEAECLIYCKSIEKALSEGIVVHSNNLEEFLDEMANKYVGGVDKTTERLFGKADITNSAYMNIKDRI